MHLHKLRISNFRAIENIEVEFDTLVSVIIGPNAIGKTTILEAVRLAKSVLAARTQNESNQTLFSLGITSPHMPQRLFPAALTTNANLPTVIKCSFKVEAAEVSTMEQMSLRLSSNLALQSIGLNFSNPAQSMGFLNSPQGQQAVGQAQSQLTAELARVKAANHIELNLTVDYQTSMISGEFPVQQLFFAALEQGLDPAQTLFSYFPADRAMPTGEQPLQLGMADTNIQLESYNSQPQLKYNRLKNMIFSSIIEGENGRKNLNDQFNLIFDRILKGRALGEIGVNEIGMLSIPIIDVESGRKFDIDGLSSGEKGLILTFLLIARSISNNGLILLDEPELHLNPAVCRDLLQFFVDEYATKKNMQAIICSHSAEILAGAFERPSCALFHLRSGTALAKVRQHDQGEIRDALRRLGSSESEALLYRGTVSVEGIHDVEILQSGFDHIFRRYKLKQLGGRGQVEADIRELQNAEKRGDEVGNFFFLFDHDGKPTALADSTHVKVRQLQRHCLENYLLDAEIITDLTREKEFSANPIGTVTETTSLMKKLALAQLNHVAARSVFKQLGLEAVGFDFGVLNNPDPSVIAAALWSRIETIKSNFEKLGAQGFSAEFERQFKVKLAELTPRWDDKWRELCDGKLLFEEMRRAGLIRGDLLKIKRRIALEMRRASTEAWGSLDSLLKDLVAMN
jgi:predicted ATPase